MSNIEFSLKSLTSPNSSELLQKHQGFTFKLLKTGKLGQLGVLLPECGCHRAEVEEDASPLRSQHQQRLIL